MSRLESLCRCAIPEEELVYRTTPELARHLQSLADCPTTVLGHSRGGQDLFGYTLGSGPLTVSITAGCHADEPMGPMTAQMLPRLLRTYAPDLLERFTFRVVPQMNPDGADRNRPWFARTPDFLTYLAHAHRELPGDDVEFGFSEGPRARPECRAAIPFLWHQSPVVAHFSLHGMAWAEGAWYLLNAPWASRSEALREQLCAITTAQGMGFHEIDRKGAKGFTRIAEGFATTPSSVAMHAFFEEQKDPAMAAKFLPSSMEVAMATGDDPLCMVSELPLFILNVPPSLEDPVLFRFRDALTAAQVVGDQSALEQLVETFQLAPVPLATQIKLQFAMMVCALDHVASRRA